jgi:hypothetical protein
LQLELQFLLQSTWAEEIAGFNSSIEAPAVTTNWYLTLLRKTLYPDTVDSLQINSTTAITTALLNSDIIFRLDYLLKVRDSPRFLMPNDCTSSMNCEAAES